MMRIRPLALIPVAAALLAAPAAGGGPALLVPPRPDSVRIASPPGPLLVPGHAPPADTMAAARKRRARLEYDRGLGFERAGSPAAAIMAYHNATGLDSTLAGPQYRTGLLFVSRQQWRAAAVSFATELVHHPENRDAARQLGLAFAQLGDTTRALIQLRLLVRRDPRDEPSWQALGFAYGVARRPADAERALRKAVTLDPRDADAWRDLGVVLATRGRGDAARGAYRRAAALDPHDAGALVNLGNLEAHDGRPDSALADYQEAERRDPGEVLAYGGEVGALRALGRADEMGPVYRRWLAVAPDAIQVRVEAIRYFNDQGRPDIAVELARDGVRVNPRDGEAWLALGLAARTTGDLRGALDDLRQAEQWLKSPEQRSRVRATLRAMRAGAPDSLRAMFAADSVAHAGAPYADSAAAGPGGAR
ncbi:MAG TPA: tetratricopeptide repeat protein [Candidatus Eisenbacteria bacterium]|nr:tetratricopeptide repeat protein [Candidatus Eisenbacteria bacterium]